MKKLLSALLGIFGLLFAVPGWALPSGYTQLEYIESTGEQYIDTGVKGTQNSKFDIDFEHTGTAFTPFGSRKSATVSSFAIWSTTDTTDGLLRIGFDDTPGYTGNSVKDMPARLHIVHSKSGTYVNDNLVATPTDYSNFTTPTNLMVFARTDTSLGLMTTPMKLYSLKLYDNNTLVRDFVPAKNSSGVVGMYDTVNNRFYTNAGTGEFIAGDPVTTCDGTIVNYTSATGTVSQAGTPTPTNPIEPVFYQQGNMVLRKVGDYADSYDATTGKITRRVGVAVLDGTEDWDYNSSTHVLARRIRDTTPEKLNNFMITHFTKGGTSASNWGNCYSSSGYLGLSNANDVMTSLDQFKQWLAQQYAAGTPVTVWYPLAEETTEDWTETSYCETPIKIATTKYNETKFSPLNTALQNAISVVDTVVSNTITQAASIATLQAQKQTRPNDIADDNEKCPAGKKCLLVEDASGVPHWYEIVENAWDLPVGYTQLQYIESTGTQYIDTGITNVQTGSVVEVTFQSDNFDGWHTVYGNKRGSNNWIAYTLNTATQQNSYIYGTYYDTDYPITTDKHTIRQESNKFYLDGTLAYTAAERTFTNDTNLLLFARASTNTEYMFHGKIYAAKIWNDGTMVGDFVPARRNSDDAIGMFDTVSGQFFTNAGTGEFIAGDPVAE